MAIPRVLLDASVLIPLNPRDLILEAARTTGGAPPLCYPYWSLEILREIREPIGKTMTRITEGERDTAVARVLVAFAAFPDVPIAGYEQYMGQVQPLDVDDRRVAAAACARQMDIPVTSNTRHSPPATFAAMQCTPDILTPDAFAVRLYAADPERLLRRLAVQVAARRQRIAEATRDTHICTLERRLPAFVAEVRTCLQGRQGNGEAEPDETSS